MSIGSDDLYYIVHVFSYYRVGDQRIRHNVLNELKILSSIGVVYAVVSWCKQDQRLLLKKVR